MSPLTRTAILTAALILTPLSLRAYADSTLHDVTAKISAQIQNDSLSLPVDGKTLTGSPSEGDVKKLKIEYTQGASCHTRVFAETQTALIHAITNQKLTIRKATFGLMPDPVDVTPKLLAAATSNPAGAITLTVDDVSLGIDPSPGTEKQLVVRYFLYTNRTQQKFLVLDQNETLTLDSKTTAVVQASYGLAQSSFDVTEIVAAQLKDNQLTIGASNDTFGGDPSSGDTKQLIISYTVDGKPHTASTEEYKPPIHLPAPSDGTGEIIITSARYGTGPTPPK